MARGGSFGGGLNPFGTGALGSLAQYDIGSDLADLSVYETEVAWGNGQATDEEYLAALRRAVEATDPTSQKRMTAQNKLDDAIYRIGRSQAEAGGLDALIAFDQAALAQMNPNNLRYRDVQDSLESEMAQRRSRDYGVLIDAYNSGDLPTSTLLAWVEHTLATLPADSPDRDNWTGVRADLTDRIQGEKDTAVFQDYQRGRMRPAEFLAYLTERRNSYEPGTPKYQEWADRLEDATVEIKEEQQARADSAFFNAYQEGKKSDASYLLYLRRRIDSMAPDDPQRAEWQHRLNQATFSLAEDKLRFDAERAQGKLDAAAKPSATLIRAADAATRKLLDFYTDYRATLNPASAEWRTVTRSIDSLTRQLATPRRSGSSGGASGGATGGATPGAAVGTGAAAGAGPDGKVISPKYTLSNILGLFAINPGGNKKAVAGAKKYLDLNMSTLNNALTRGDDVWLFHDPRYPGATIPGQHPDGSPMLDANGKPVMVRGSAYLPVSSEAFSNLKTVESSNFMAAAEIALSKGKYGDYAYNLRRAGESLDQARLEDAQHREQNWEAWYKATSVAVDKLTMAGDYGTAMRTALDLAARLDLEAANPYLDDTRRRRLEELGEKLADNKLMPKADEQGNIQYEGAVNLAELAKGNVVLNPGWHHVLKSNDRGQPDWGPVFDPYQDGRWETKYVTVHTTLGDKLVTGDAVRTAKANLNPSVRIRTDEGYRTIELPGTAEMLSFVDEHGLVQRAYSIDGGRSWIRPAAGMPAPSIEINADLRQQTDANGLVSYVDATTGDVVLAQNAQGGWALTPAYVQSNPGVLSWHGQAAWEKARQTPAGKQQLEFDEVQREARRLNVVDARFMEMGAPGQHMTLAYASPAGIVNLLPSGFTTPYRREANQRRAGAAGQRTIPIASVSPPGARDDWRSDRQPSTQRGASAATLAAADTRRQSSGLSSYQIVARQLPPDTPARFDGYSTPPPQTVTRRPSASHVLPALVAPTRTSLPPLATRRPTTVTPPIPRTPPPPPRVPSTATTAAANTRVLASKAPPPPPVRTPTATPGVTRPASVTRSGPLR